MSKTICSNFNTNLKTNFTSMGTNMISYYKKNNTPLQFPTLIDAFNFSVGVSASNNVVFFQFDTLLEKNFNQTIFTNFWTDNSTIDTPSSITLITDFLINESNVAENSSNNSDSYSDFYTKFANPYANFIINMLFCNNTPNINFNDNNIVLNNLYQFLNGNGTGNYGGTRGAGTITLCNFCMDFLTNIKPTLSIDNYYKYISKNSNLQDFCGCCYELLNSQPAMYSKSGSIDLSCQPICFKDSVIKSYNGEGTLVNTGMSNNINLNSNPDYTRVQCVGQTVCIIDNPNISMIGGNNQVVFNQLCPGCADNKCTCFLDTTQGNIDVVTNGIEGLQNSVVFNQNCPISFCVTSQGDSNGNITYNDTPCNPYNTADTGKDPNNDYNGDGDNDINSNQATRDYYIFGVDNWIVPLIFFFLGIIAIFCILVVDILNIKQQIFIVKPKGLSLDNFKK
jgi:hypothetical protein